MPPVLRADAAETKTDDAFVIRRTRPGTVLDNPEDTALGPLAFVDHATLGEGTVVSMHEHRDDEILSYLWRGRMVHEDTTGEKVTIHPGKLMMMNSGSGFEHEEAVPDGSVEMLQIFVRPRAAGLDPRVTFHERTALETDEWQTIATPEDGDGPLFFNQRVWFHDIRLGAGRSAPVPSREGTAQWLYLMDGSVRLTDGTELEAGDGAAGIDAPLGEMTALADTDAVLFQIDLDAEQTREGKFSGRK